MFNLHVFNNEIQRKYKGISYWLLGMLLYSFLIIVLYDSFSEQLGELTSLFESGAYEGLLAAFSSSSESLTTYEGFFSVEYVSFGLIIGAIFGAYLGVSTIGKEISGKTITFLLSKPVSRVSTYISKFLGLATALLIANVVLTVLNIIGTEIFSSKAEVAPGFYIAIYAAVYFYMLFFLALGQAIAVIISEGKALGISVGLSVGALMFNFMKSIESVPPELQYLNPQFYVDVEEIGTTSALPAEAWLLVIAALLITFAGALWYKEKDLNV